MRPKETITAFDSFLAEKDLSLEAVVIGGAALGLLGVVTRQTRDCDILHPELPTPILAAAREFAKIRSIDGDLLAEDWLNNGPASIVDSFAELARRTYGSFATAWQVKQDFKILAT